MLKEVKFNALICLFMCGILQVVYANDSAFIEKKMKECIVADGMYKRTNIQSKKDKVCFDFKCTSEKNFTIFAYTNKCLDLDIKKGIGTEKVLCEPSYDEQSLSCNNGKFYRIDSSVNSDSTIKSIEKKIPLEARDKTHATQK